MQSLPTLQLTSSQLATFVRSAGAEITQLSPAHGADGSPSADLPGSIAAHADAFAPIARTLARPRIALAASTATSDSVVYIHAFGSPATGRELVGCTEAQGGMFELVPALDSHTWPLVLFKGLALDTVPDGPVAAAPMSRAALLACAALVDAIKEARLNALLAREGYPEPIATTNAIAVAAKAAALVPDARWFSGLVRRLLPDDAGTVSLKETREGLNELGKLGWVTSTGENEWAFTETMQPHAAAWSSAAVSGLFSLHLDEPGGMSHLHLGMIRTLSGLWTIECPPQGTMVKMGTTGGRALMLTLTKTVEKLLALGSDSPETTNMKAGAMPAPAPTGTGQICASCGAAFPVGAHFCAVCGKPVAAPATESLCSGCGQPVHPGEKFCRACGRRIS